MLKNEKIKKSHFYKKNIKNLFMGLRRGIKAMCMYINDHIHLQG